MGDNFEKLSPVTIKVEEVGGKNEIIKYAKKVLSGEIDCIVAMDSDYDKLELENTHPNIISTYGYSIENTIVGNEVLDKVLKNTCRLPRRALSEAISKDWLTEVSRSIKPLVLTDLVNHEDQLGLTIIPENSDRFMSSKKSCSFCDNKIENHLNGLGVVADANNLLKQEAKLTAIGLQILDMLRGHFLISAVFRFMKYTVNKLKNNISISKEMLFGSLLTAFESLFDNSHPHYGYYQNSLRGIQ